MTANTRLQLGAHLSDIVNTLASTPGGVDVLESCAWAEWASSMCALAPLDPSQPGNDETSMVDALFCCSGPSSLHPAKPMPLHALVAMIHQLELKYAAYLFCPSAHANTWCGLDAQRLHQLQLIYTHWETYVTACDSLQAECFTADSPYDRDDEHTDAATLCDANESCVGDCE